MKKFTFKGVFDGFRSSVAQQVKPEQEIVETLRSEHFQAKKVSPQPLPAPARGSARRDRYSRRRRRARAAATRAAARVDLT